MRHCRVCEVAWSQLLGPDCWCCHRPGQWGFLPPGLTSVTVGPWRPYNWFGRAG